MLVSWVGQPGVNGSSAVFDLAASNAGLVLVARMENPCNPARCDPRLPWLCNPIRAFARERFPILSVILLV